MKKANLKKVNSKLKEVTLNILNKDPASLPKTGKDGLKVGNVVVKKNVLSGVDIYDNNKMVYEGIQETSAVMALVNRLSTKNKIREIPQILNLESQYVRILNDIKFIKNRFNGAKNWDDKEICQHRLLILSDKLKEVSTKLSSLIII